MVKKKAQFKVTDNVTIKRIDNITGEVLDEETFHNLIVDNGLTRIADLIGKQSTSGFDYIGIGTDNTAPANGNTALGTEVERELASISKPATNQVKYVKVFTFGTGVSHTITEAGLFDAASSGTMLNRLTFTGKDVDTNTDLSVTVTITVSRV